LLIPTIEEHAKHIPINPLTRPHKLTGEISGSTIIVREYNPEPPIPCIARKTMSWFMDCARPLAKENPENKIQAKMTAPLRPMPSLSLANMMENPV
jgi:hypothetical protein